MSRTRAIITGVSTLALVAAFSAPSLAATVINDAELDQVTAAGQPKIAQANGYESADAYNYQKYRVAGKIQSSSQTQLRALTLNNVFGENQVASGTNIQAVVGTSNESRQDNRITQSWGAAKAWKAVTVEGKRGGDVYVKTPRKALINQVQATGGNAAPGKIGALWAFADEIAEATSSDGYADAYNEVYTEIGGVIETNSQENLNALTVNNVFGLNQVANALNIVSGAVGPNLGAATGTSGTQQFNEINQYRGTPANAAAMIDAQNF